MKLIPEKDCPELQRDPKSGVWYYRKFVSGKGAFFKSTKERHSKTRAKTIGVRMFAEWMGTAQARRAAAYFFEDIADKYLEQKKNRRRRTIISAEAHVNLHLRPYFEGMPISECAHRWENYIAYKRESAPNRKFYNDTKHMRGILRLAFGLGVINILPVLRCPDPKVRIGKEYSEREIKALLKNASPDLALQIRLAVIMGMRRSEILQLSWDRIDLQRSVIILMAENVKTNDGREVPIHPEVYSELKRRYVSLKKDSSRWLFPSPIDDSKPVADNKTAWRECRARANVSGRFHDLRHTAVTRMLFIYSIPPSKVAAITGMSLAVMNRYAHPKGAHLHDDIRKIRGFGVADAEE
jgi:integrase